jgi:hypothetical protein
VFSLAYVVASYGCYCSYCRCSTKVEKKIIIIQKHKKPTNKKKPKKLKAKKNLPLSTLSDKE